MRYRLILLGACVVCVFAVVGAPALAAAPETPVLTVEEPFHASTATFLGVLNPGSLGEPPQSGTYKFLYKAGTSTECKGGSETVSGLSFGGAPEPLAPETVTGLTPNTQYAVCLSVTNLENPPKTTVSAPAPFKTAIPSEKPVTGAATSVTSETEKLEGTLNPNPHTTLKVGGYFAYSNPAGSSCTEGPTAGLEEFEGEKEEATIPVHTTIGGLQPHKEYKYCLVATNDLGETTIGNEVSLETSPSAPTVEGLTASQITPFAATLEAQVNPENEPTGCTFEYGLVEAVKLEKEAPCEQGTTPGTLEGYGNQTATANIKLSPNETYYYRLTTKNPAGKTEANEKLTTPTTKQPTITNENVSAVTPTEATLNAKVNPDYQKTTYTFEYAPSEASLLKSEGIKSPATALAEESAELPASDALTGLKAGVTYYYRITVKNETTTETINATIQSFTPQGEPLAATSAAQDVTRTAANVSGTVNPAGSETHYHFAYIEQAAYQEALAKHAKNPYEQGRRTPETSIPAGYTTQTVGPLSIEYLSPGTTYDYALIATSSTGTNIIAANETLTTSPSTPPMVLNGGQASNITINNATLNATINPEGLETSYVLELGSDTSYGTSIAGEVGANTQPINIEVSIINLEPATTYHYRFLAVSSDGRIAGPDETFTTPAYSHPITLPPVEPLLPTPPIAFPAGNQENTGSTNTTTTTKKLTNAQKLAKALRTCAKQPKHKRATCQKQARSRYEATKQKTGQGAKGHPKKGY